MNVFPTKGIVCVYELKLALHYLIPKRKAFSVALLSLVSLLVTALVFWLVLVFLSITHGIEQTWLKKLTSLHAPIRIHPTPAYYNSYYYKIDRVASASHYSPKTLGEKKEAVSPNPFNIEIDPELPSSWPAFEGRDLVKELFSTLGSIPGLAYEDYEMSGALLRLGLTPSDSDGVGTHLSQMSYLLSFSFINPHLPSLLVDGTIFPPPENSPLQGIYLPKGYQDQGVALGAKGSLNYITQTAGSQMEQQIPVQVLGFYDPGLLPLGNKSILVSKEVTQTLLAATETFSPDGTPMNGVFVWIQDLKKAGEIKQEIEAKLEKGGLSSYFAVTTYEEFPFAKDFLQQLQSDRLLLFIIASIILIVACCNVLSFSVLLVNDKKREIATLRAIGASKKSILAIFSVCGALIGLLSTTLGTVAAWATLHSLPYLFSLFGKMGGPKGLHPLLLSSSSPLSGETVLILGSVTLLLSTLAGLVPALKIARAAPAASLRSAWY